MKSYIKTGILLLWILGGLNTFSQKKILTPDCYQEWKRIDNPDLSPDGKWVIYNLVSKEQSELYLYETATQQTFPIPGAETAFFWRGGKGLYYQTQDSIILLDLPNRKKQRWTKTAYFQPLGETEWVPQTYTVSSKPNNTFTRLVLHHVGHQDSICLDHIGYYTFYNDYRSIIYIQEDYHHQAIRYGNLGGPYRTLYSTPGKKLNNFQFDQETGKGYFFIYPDSLVYSFSLKTHHYRLLCDLRQLPGSREYTIRNIKISENQEYLTYELHSQSSPSAVSTANNSTPGFELQLWSWNEDIPQSRLEKTNKSHQPSYSRYTYSLSSRKMCCFDSIGNRQVIQPPCSNHHYFITIDKTPYLKYEDRKENLNFDAYLIDIHNATSRPIAQNLTELPIWDPTGRYILFYRADQKTWYCLDCLTGMTVDISSCIGFPVYDEIHDLPSSAPSYGIAGWSEDGTRVGIYDRYDIWVIDLNNPQKKYSLTRGYGRKNKKIIRLCKINFVTENLKLHTTNRVKIIDEENKQEGIYLLSPDGKLQKQMEGNYSLQLLKQSVNGKYILFQRQNYNEYRNLWWSRSDFKHPQKLTDANPQQKTYNWGTVRLLQWTNDEGKENKGLLYLPENYNPSYSYPMLVQFYETHSQDLFVYHTPSPSAAMADIPTFVSQGYIVFMPDIHFTVGNPGESCYNTVVSGVKMLIDQGIADPQRIGLQGHSWSGFQTAYLVTRTSLFRCANIGAPVVDMPSAYVGVRNGSGRVRFFMYEDTQSRMGKTLWEDRDAYLSHSPLLYADQITTPLLILHNDADEAVSYEQGRGLFLAMRRLQKPAWLVNYKGEGHFLSNPSAQYDWTIRMQQFFDYYLKDTPPPDWMKEGLNKD